MRPPTNRGFSPLAGVLALLSAGAIVALPATAQDSEKKGAQAVVDELIHDFGRVTRATVAEHTFTIENQGDEPLLIRDVSSSCACTVAEHDSTIAPGETGEIRVQLDTDLINGAYQAMVTLYTNDPDKARIDLTLKVETYPYIHVTPGYFRYIVHQNFPGEIVVNQRVRAIEPKDFSIVRAESPHPFVEVTHRRLEGDELDPRHGGPEYLVSARLKNDAPVGPLTGYIRLYFDHEKQKKASIPVSGFVRPVFAVTPAQGNFRTIEIGEEPVRANFHVKQFSEGPISIEEVVTDVPGLLLDLETIKEGREFWLHVTVPPDMPKGPFAGKVTLKTSSDLDREIEVPIRGTVG